MDSRYLPQLDGLRFFAILSVMIGHWFQWQVKNEIFEKIPFAHGVLLFFVLSGFLITRILLIEKDNVEKAATSKKKLLINFYVRRFIRIMPIYYLTVLLMYIINYQQARALTPWLLTYTSNIYQSLNNCYVGGFTHFWSLAVEEQFYLFWPLLILFVTKEKILKVIVITIVLSLFSRFIFVFLIDMPYATDFFTTNVLFALAFGGGLAYLHVFKASLAFKIAKNRFYLPISILTYIIFSVFFHYYGFSTYFPLFDQFLFSIVMFFVVAKASTSDFTGIFKWLLTNKYSIYLGKISYGLYVFHLFIPDFFWFMQPKWGLVATNKYMACLLYFGLSVAFAHLSWELIEKPINLLKSRFQYSQKS